MRSYVGLFTVVFPRQSVFSVRFCALLTFYYYRRATCHLFSFPAGHRIFDCRLRHDLLIIFSQIIRNGDENITLQRWIYTFYSRVGRASYF